MDKEEKAKIEQLSNTQVSYALDGIAKFYGFSDFEKAIFHEAVERLKSSWTHINPADPGTLPPLGERVLVTTWLVREESFVIPGRRVADGIVNIFGDNVAGHIYAWQPWPEPPPYPGTAETQDTTP